MFRRPQPYEPRHIPPHYAAPVGDPAKLPRGQRQHLLDLLAKKASLLRRASRRTMADWTWMTPEYRHPVMRMVLVLLGERARNRVDIDWSSKHDLALFESLLLREPSEYGEDDFELVVRSLFMHDRGIGMIDMSFSQAIRTGFLAKIVRAWDSPQPTSLFRAGLTVRSGTTAS